MRRRSTPIGWPRRDPRYYRFAIPTAVWEYQLRPAEFVIFSYLCYHRSTSKLTLEEITAGVHVTTNTVKKYLDSLIAKKLIGEDGTPALKSKDKKFFTLPNEVFLLRLPPSAFMVYAYLLLIEDRRTHTCHPSYNTIATATNLVKNTAMKSVSTLLEMGLIAVEPSSYFDKRGMKWKGNNLYTILPVRAAVDTFHQRQLRQLELDVERRRVIRRQQEYDRRHPRAALCTPAVAEATLDPAQQCKPLYAG
ncbi:helix-turn-helix domain-containing protein [Oscillibacter sp. CU971]|uniref:helix-turn-helix domain-containing protein n=1 Tax=Oscillibacter sp. CU971 TaxID=2780102 RepID=UPI00195AF63D|nr:helix-turn-helix domain-containing protein [Oscillibacter sp. CU971]